MRVRLRLTGIGGAVIGGVVAWLWCGDEFASPGHDRVAEVRKSDTPIRIVFTPEEQTNPVFVAQAKKLVEFGNQANVEVTVLDNAFPDTMRPTQNADQAVQVKVASAKKLESSGNVRDSSCH